MKLSEGNFFHIYNRGNNKQPIFFNRDNYLYFLKKVNTHLKQHADILAWCLMPNHFHILIFIPEGKEAQSFSIELQIMLRSYTRGVNKQQDRTGSLFTQNTRSKQIEASQYLLTCFNYIHQNPLKAKLVDKMEDWEFSSFVDYTGDRNGKLISREIAMKFMDLPSPTEELYKLSYEMINENLMKHIL